MPNYTRLLTRAEADAQGLTPMGAETSAVRKLAGAYPQAGTPYAAATAPFLSPLGIPCSAPPWGRISAIDLHTRRLVWSRPLGTTRSTGPLGVASHVPLPLGVPLLGGGIVTRGGLVFIGASVDQSFRALDVATGRTLWSYDLPYSGIATPMSYRTPDGRQFVIIAAGGHVATCRKTGDVLLAFALPPAPAR